MAGIGDDETRGGAPSGCPSCGAAMSDDQRYCLGCGARRPGLPAAVAATIAASTEPPPPPVPVAAPASGGSWFPDPRAAAAAVMAMMALGVILGSVGQQVAQSAGFGSIVVNLPPEAPLAVAPEPEEEEPAEAAPEPEPVVPAAAPAPEEPAPEEPAPDEPPPEEPPPTLPEEERLPPIEHVFVIALGENGYGETFGQDGSAPYLKETLPAIGQLLPNYYAVAGAQLANEVALLSGQGPTPETLANCPVYTDVTPGTLDESGQAEGSGCVYPAGAETLVGQLVAAGRTWKAYVEDIGSNPAEPVTCRHPALGEADPRQAPTPGDAYLTWRNPFVYFRGVVDDPSCAERDVGLDRLAADLEAPETTPTLSYIVPNACHDGGLTPCAEGAPSGPAEAEAFLGTVVPEIIASDAYKNGGLIAITSMQAQQGGEAPDHRACCVYPEYPNLPPPVEEAVSGPTRASGGGGKVGLVLISPYVEPGTVNGSYYNHYSLLRSIGELFELPPLGYAAEPALTGFDGRVYGLAPTAEEEEWLLPRR